MFLYVINTSSRRGIEADKAVLGDDLIATNEGYSDCCGIFGITCQKDDSSCVVSVD